MFHRQALVLALDGFLLDWEDFTASIALLRVSVIALAAVQAVLDWSLVAD